LAPPTSGKKVVSRKKAAPTPPTSEPVVHDVFEKIPEGTSYMDLLQDAEVDIGAPPLDPFEFGDDLHGEEEEVGEGEEEEDELTEIGVEAFAAGGRRKASNYTEAEDIILVRAWASVGMDACTGTDQTGKRYWQRIEDAYCKMKPKTGGFAPRTFRSLQGRWELMKPSCARWSAAMSNVIDAPPSGTVESDYVSIYACFLHLLCHAPTMLYVCLLCHLCLCRRTLPRRGTCKWPVPRASNFLGSMFGSILRILRSGS
jgi:hypothetical protein